MVPLIVYLFLGIFLILTASTAKGYLKDFTFLMAFGFFMLLVFVGFMHPLPSQANLYFMIFNSFAIISLLTIRGPVGMAAAIIQMGFIFYLIMAWFR